MEDVLDMQQQSLSIQAARNLATTTKSVPQMIGITPRWLLRLLPWVQVDSGTYRINRRRVVLREDERIRLNLDEEKLEARHLRALTILRDLDGSLLDNLAAKFVSEQYGGGETILAEGRPGDRFYIIARGKVEVSMRGKYDQPVRLAILGEGDYFGEIALLEKTPRTATVQTITPCVLLALDGANFDALLDEAPEVKARFEQVVKQRREASATLVDQYGERKIDVTAGHYGEPELPRTFVDYEVEPREYPLNVVQSVLRIHTRVTDIYNDPINQLREQTRLTIEAIKERQEWEMINNREFGLIHAATSSMRVQTRTGAPTPDDMDELLAKVWKKPAFFLAHPRAIAAFGRECTRRGVPPPAVNMFGSPFLTWRGVPLVPTDKLSVGVSPDSSIGTTSILLMRVGETEQGVVGLHQMGIPDEKLPSLSVRFMGIDNRAIASYLITLYFSVAVLVDDALGVLENVEVTSYYDYK